MRAPLPRSGPPPIAEWISTATGNSITRLAELDFQLRRGHGLNVTKNDVYGRIGQRP